MYWDNRTVVKINNAEYSRFETITVTEKFNFGFCQVDKKSKLKPLKMIYPEIKSTHLTKIMFHDDMKIFKKLEEHTTGNYKNKDQ